MGDYYYLGGLAGARGLLEGSKWVPLALIHRVEDGVEVHVGKVGDNSVGALGVEVLVFGRLRVRDDALHSCSLGCSQTHERVLYHLYTYIHTYTHTHLYMYVSMYVSMYVCMYAYVYIYI